MTGAAGHPVERGSGLALAASMAPLIRQRLGLVIPEHLHADLEQALADAAGHFGYASARHLADSFAALNDAAPELNYLVGRVTVGESFFFRDAAQMAFLREEFLPALLRERQAAGRTLRVWSAAAAQGQELYSVAMLLHQLLDGRTAGWNLHLLGTDINTEGLATALHGEYREWSLRGVDAAQRERHFQRRQAEGQPAAWRVDPAVQAMTRFAWLNLASETFPSVLTDTHTMDLILCRNVFIYFDPALVRRILARLVQCLAPGGVLLLGPSDIVDTRIEGLQAGQRSGMFFYRKPLPERPPAAPAADALAQAPSLLERLRALSAARRWLDVVALDPGPPGGCAGELQLLATAYGNLGRHAEALQRCGQALQLAATDKQLHFLQALLLQEAGDAASAKTALKRALFLDPAFLEAHYQLGMLLRTEGQGGPALKSLSNALSLAQRCPPTRRLLGDPDLSIAQLIEILRHELELREDGG
ncbi:protein-glutamate O-methyltransferase CheR [Pelomonas sp. KK5]|uniref:CheR family methyltransferase n=1 Tax=Pelomonas sp. KK5 TaxID=1855730 RepID=UPI00097C6B76|nr:protein-glutamate O-methyltransferase CheR [Pelomonas sp. KK5]